MSRTGLLSRMLQSIILAWLLLPASTTTTEESGACLLQHGASERYKGVAVHEALPGLGGGVHETRHRQEPEGDSNSNEAGNVESSGGAKDASGENEGKEVEIEENNAGNSGEKSNEESEENNAGNSGEKSNEESNDVDNTESNELNESNGSKSEDKKKGDTESNSEDKKGDTESNSEDKKGKGEKGAKDEKDSMEEWSLSSLRLELRLKASIPELVAFMGDLPSFNENLKQKLAKAAGINTNRLDVLGVRGAFSDEGLASSLLEKHVNPPSPEDTPMLMEIDKKHSIVDIEVMAGIHKSDLNPKGVYSALQKALASKDSSLMDGEWKDVLKGAKLKVKGGVEGLLPRNAASPKAAMLSSLALLVVHCWFL